MNAIEQLHDAARILRHGGTTALTPATAEAAAAWLLAEANLAASPYRVPMPQAVEFATAILRSAT